MEGLITRATTTTAHSHTMRAAIVSQSRAAPASSVHFHRSSSLNVHRNNRISQTSSTLTVQRLKQASLQKVFCSVIETMVPRDVTHFFLQRNYCDASATTTSIAGTLSPLLSFYLPSACRIRGTHESLCEGATCAG